jgi:RNA polymerase sigma factor (sigma-70 family)
LIIEGIQRQDADMLKYVYKHYFPMVKQFVMKNHGTEEDAQDVFQEAVVAVFQRVRRRKLVLDCSFKTYFYSVVRHIWLQYLERTKTRYEFTELDEYIIMEEPELYDDFREKRAIYQRHFLQLTELCRQVLLMFVDKVPFEDIAAKLGYKGRQYAIKRKYECMKSLINRVSADPEYKRLNQ